MTRRVLTLLAAVLTCLAGFSAAATTAYAAEVEVTYSPISLGDYCSARVNSSSTIGFYNGGLGCYRWGTGPSGLVYTGSGSASAACAYYNPTATYLSHSQGAGQALICKYSV